MALNEPPEFTVGVTEGAWLPDAMNFRTRSQVFEPDAEGRSQFELDAAVRLPDDLVRLQVLQICLQFPANTRIFLDFRFLDASTQQHKV